MNRGAQHCGALVDRVHQRRRPGEHGLEHYRHDHKQADGARQRAIHEMRDPRPEGRDRRRRTLRVAHDVAHPGVSPAGLTRQRRFIGEYLRPGFSKPEVAALTQQLADLGGQFAARINQRAFDLETRYRVRQSVGQLIGCVMKFCPVSRRLRYPVTSQARERSQQFIDALPGRRDHRADRDTPESATQCIDIDADTAGLRSVRHRQCHEYRQPEREQLLHEVETLVEMCCVNHGEDAARPFHIGYPAEDDICGNALFERMGRQREHPGQVDQLDALRADFRDAGMPFDSDARIVSGPLP